VIGDTRHFPDQKDDDPTFVAYVYPGWHESDYRPGTNEWELLSRYQPYFPGHPPPLRPIAGAYDDAEAATTAAQIALALQAGITAFAYFMYYEGTRGFVLSKPMTNAVRVQRPPGADFRVAGVWCVRLPHDRFPLPSRRDLEAGLTPPSRRGATATATPLELLTLRDLEQLVSPDSSVWSSVTLCASPTMQADRARVQSRRLAAVPGDSRPDSAACRAAAVRGVRSPDQDLAALAPSDPRPTHWTLRKVKALLEGITAAMSHRGGQPLTVLDVDDAVTALGMADLSFNALATLGATAVDAPDLLAAFTLAELEEILGH
jgi:hypothetical protein